MLNTETTRLKRTKPPRNQAMRQAIDYPYMAARELVKRNFAKFIQFFWDAISSDSLIWNWHIDYLCDQLFKIAIQVAEGHPKEYDLIINIPPGTTKSMTCSVMFPVWCWTNWPWMRFIASSYSGALALEQAEISRDLVNSDKFRRTFPELSIRHDKDTKSNFRITKRVPNRAQAIQGGSRYSTSVGGTLTGFHGHILIVDDPIDPNRAVSEVETATANRWIDQTLSTRKVDKATTPTILIMQRLHQDDPTGHILEKGKSNVKHICLPGEIKNYSNHVKPTHLKERYVDNLLDLKRMGWNVLKDLEVDLGQYGYAGQIGQSPTPPQGGMFQPDQMGIVSEMPSWRNCVKKIWYWDKAGTKDEGAYTCGVYLWEMDIKRYPYRFIVVRVVRGQWEANERERRIKNAIQGEDHNAEIYIEQEPGSGGKESGQNTVNNLAGFRVQLDRPTGDKIYRADPFSVQVNNGNVALLQADWNRDYKEEFRFFPYSKYKDQVDASSGAFAKATIGSRAGVW